MIKKWKCLSHFHSDVMMSHHNGYCIHRKLQKICEIEPNIPNHIKNHVALSFTLTSSINRRNLIKVPSEWTWLHINIINICNTKD